MKINEHAVLLELVEMALEETLEDLNGAEVSETGARLLNKHYRELTLAHASLVEKDAE